VVLNYGDVWSQVVGKLKRRCEQNFQDNTGNEFSKQNKQNEN
jgi:hypothetical protein